MARELRSGAGSTVVLRIGGMSMLHITAPGVGALMPNPFHDPHLAHVVRAVASQRVQVRPALTSPDDLQRVRDVFAGYVKRFESMLEMQARDGALSQARTNCQSALSYLDAIAFDLTTIDQGIVTALLGWLDDAVHLAEVSPRETVPSDQDQADRAREILKTLQTTLRASGATPGEKL